MKLSRCSPIIFSFILIYGSGIGQTIQQKFNGLWADTYWEFQFNKNGTYSRVTGGHYGGPNTQGTYRLKKDTILLLTGFENTNGTVNPKYLLDKDSMLIDLTLRYDYKPVSQPGSDTYVSIIRDVKYPQIPTTNTFIKKELAAILHRVFRSDTLRNNFSTDKFPGRTWYLQQYKYLEIDIKIPGEVCKYVPAAEITVPYYIEIEDINYNDNFIEVDLKLHGLKLGARFYYFKRDGKWSDGHHIVFKNEY